MKTKGFTHLEALKYDILKEKLKKFFQKKGFSVFHLPIITPKHLFEEKDKKLRMFSLIGPKKEYILAPEGTKISVLEYKKEKIDKILYVSKFFRHETTQKDRFWEFEQFGLEYFCTPQEKDTIFLYILKIVLSFFISEKILLKIQLSSTGEGKKTNFFFEKLTKKEKKYIKIDRTIQRGLDYYDGFVFEGREIDKKKQIIGGGQYIIDGQTGVGFGIGLERLFSSFYTQKSISLLGIICLEQKTPNIRKTDLKKYALVDKKYFSYPNKGIAYFKLKNFTHYVVIGKKEIAERKASIQEIISKKKISIVRLNRDLHPNFNRDRVM